MARPERNTVDYFPFLCDEGKKMFYIEEAYGNDGFATFIKILRELGKTDFHFLNLSNPKTKMFLSAKCKVSVTVLENIIQDLVDLEKFDTLLWKEDKIIWCQDFIDSIQDAYKRRNNKCITYEGLLLHLASLGVRKPSKCKLKGNVKPQSKVKDSKEEETILNNKKEDFKKSLEIYLDTYGKNLLNDFYIYWVEMKPKGVKMRWEMEKTWQLNLRLSRWYKNNAGKYNKNEVSVDNTTNR